MPASNDSPLTRRRSTKKQATIGSLVLAMVVAVYSFGQPILNERFGWNLPELPQTHSPAVVEPKRPVDVTSTTKTTPPRLDDVEQTAVPAGKRIEKYENHSEPSNGRVHDEPKLLFGLLKDLGSDRFVSPSGLMFTRGGAEGHRLDHLERHTVDDPSRPGKHGVFDGGMAGALATIDRAYEKAKTGSRTTKEIDEGRIIYTVDMGSRIGYIGGRDGNRLKKPMARRVRMVLDNNRVITAYPL